MPIYEYKCSSCDHQFEVMQRLADAPLATCETCGGSLEKLISAPAFQFKGKGWYVTDYAKKGKESGENVGESTDSKDDKGSGAEKSDDSSKAGAESTSTSTSDSSSTKSSSTTSSSPKTD